MLSPTQIFELGKPRSGTALFPVRNATSHLIAISTRVGDVLIDKGDGSPPYLWSPPRMNDFTSNQFGGTTVNYSTPFTGNISIKFLNGLKDVYSWQSKGPGTGSKASTNITDIETFFKQFPNLYSIHINEYAYDSSANMGIIKCDLAKLPDSVEKVLLESIQILNIANDLVLNFSSYSSQSKLKSFVITAASSNYAPKIIGDLSKLPPLCNLLDLRKASAGSAITYTAGKVWASAFDTLYLPIPLTATETDNLFIDFDNSVITAVGSKIFSLSGFRSYLSDGPKANIVSKGFSVAPMNQIRSYATLGTTETTPNFYAYIPNTTSLDFGTGSLRFGCKVKIGSNSGAKGIIGKSVAAANILGRYAIYMSGNNILVLSETILGSPTTNTVSATAYSDGNFHTIDVECNRTTGKQTLKIDGVLINTTSFTPSNNNITRNARFMIGAYGDSTGNGLLANSELNGTVKDVYVTQF